MPSHRTAVLILRSSCQSQDQTDGLPTFDTIEEQEGHQFSPDSLPIWCDLTLIPEIPLSTFGAKKDSTLHVLPEEALNPCGTDNILVLHGIPPALENRYLMSIQNCFVRFRVDDEAASPVPITPSTFSFQLGVNGDEAHDETHNIIDTSDYVSLGVAFDLSIAMKDILGQEDDEDVEANSTKTETHPHSPDPLDHCHGAFEHEQGSNSEIDDDFLRILEAMTEKETCRIDQMLWILCFVFLCLVAVYLWLVVDLMKNKGRTTKRSTSKAEIAAPLMKGSSAVGEKANGEFGDYRNSACAISNNQGCSAMELTMGESSGVTAVHTKWPPVEDIIISHSDEHSMCSRVASARTVDLEPPPLVFEGRQTIETNQPPTAMSVRKQIPHRSTSAPICALPDKAASSRPLSPCSRLAREWAEKKAERRSKRRPRTKITPAAAGATATTTTTTTITTKIPKTHTPIPLTNSAPSNPFADSIKKAAAGKGNQAKLKLLPIADDSIPNPVRCTVSDVGSFLNDYW